MLRTLTKRCTKCGHALPLERFTVRRSGSRDGLHSWCNPCRGAQNRQITPPEKQREYSRRWEQKARRTPRGRLQERCKEALKTALGRKKGGRSTKSIFGYDHMQLVEHIERQFLPGMAWENYGSAWHIDHIRPQASFELIGPDGEVDWQAVRDCWSLTNLRPLWAVENIRKRAKRTHLI